MFCTFYCIIFLRCLKVYVFIFAVCSSADLATAVHNFITSDPDLHQKVLLYEPIWIEQLHADLKANNFKLKMNQLMDYLDEQVRKHYIIFCVWHVYKNRGIIPYQINTQKCNFETSPFRFQ
jgi:hypothetical protein